MIQAEDRHLKIIYEILAKYPYQFYVFGSRAKGTAKEFSDLDLCVKEDIDKAIIQHIREDFENSNLPFVVDIIEWDLCAEDFKSHIENDLTAILFTLDFGNSSNPDGA